VSELDYSEDDEPMDISDGMSLNKGNTSTVTVARPHSGEHKALFSMQDIQPESGVKAFPYGTLFGREILH
jgi:hypothetical protein